MSGYPDTHPRAAEISGAKALIDGLYRDLRRNEENSRENYRFAMEHLKAMGEDHKLIHGILKEIAKELEALKGLIDSPTI